MALSIENVMVESDYRGEFYALAVEQHEEIVELKRKLEEEERRRLWVENEFREYRLLQRIYPTN